MILALENKTRFDIVDSPALDRIADEIDFRLMTLGILHV